MRAGTLSTVLTLVTAGSVVAASPLAHKHHKHAERHEGRRPDNVQTASIAGPTVIAYELNNQPVSEEDVCKGIRDGSLKWAEGTENPLECSTGQMSFAQPTTTPLATGTVSRSVIATTVPSASIAAPQIDVEQKQAVKPPDTSASEDFESDMIQVTNTAVQSQQLTFASTGSASGKGLERDFPDGIIDCSTFPSDYGPIKIDWTELGGWTGIQYVTIQDNSITHIDTAIPGGEGCKPGAMCSYACPAGYQKSQWPSAQGSTGQSVGGLHCKENGKLSLTNPSLSKKLCIKGTGATKVQNNLSSNAAICRTDYPGT